MIMVFIFLRTNHGKKHLSDAGQKYNQGKLIGYCHTTINFWHLNYFNIEDYNRLDDFKKFSPDFIAVSSEISKFYC